MKLIDTTMEEQISSGLLISLNRRDYKKAGQEIIMLVNRLHSGIPDNKRISYGIVYVTITLFSFLHQKLSEKGAPIFPIAEEFFKESRETKVKGVALGMLSLIGKDDYQKVLPFFESGAVSGDWQMREFSQAFFRKIIKAHPEEIHDYLAKKSGSDEPFMRRFAAETLRPVVENRWFYRQPEYSLSILRQMFKESHPYPRTSVGNNLSDLARRLPELVYKIVEELVASGDKNSYWIASRACRNLVKKEPLRVMDLLKTDEYKYKNRKYRRSDY
jgi:3-methyladenine DNA glycosylase AlkC